MRLPVAGRLGTISLIHAVLIGSAAGGVVTNLAATTAAKGTIEICKSAANGMTGRSFPFTYKDHTGKTASVAVSGGGCSATLSVTAGNMTITEAASSGTTVQAIAVSPSFRQVSQNLATRTAVVRAPAGLSQTVITYTNVTTTPAAQLKICKQADSSSTGLIGQAFKFSVNGGTAKTVDAGAFGSPKCTGLTTYAAGTSVSVQELQPAPNVSVSSIGVTAPPATNVTTNLTTRTASLTLGSGVNVVTYTNTSAPPPTQLKICKQAASNSTQLIGQPFSFSINGGTATSVDAGAYGSPNCTGLTTYAAGTTVSVQELQPAQNVSVTAIGVTQPPATNVTTNLSTRTASLTLGSGVNIVTYTNQVTVVPQMGYVEVCKYGSDQFVSGYFSFSMTDSAGLSYGPYSVLVKQCTAPIQVTAGPVTITEAPRFPYALSAVNVYPAVRFVSDNLSNGSAIVNVVAGDVNTETLANFVNDTQLGQIEVCKALDSAGSDALAGNTFTFPYTDAAGGGTLSIVANSYENGPACASIPTPAGNAGLPLGSSVSISETAAADVVLLGVSVAPAAANNGSTNSTANLTVQAGIAVATFTNQAEGTLEVCKDAADPQTLGDGTNPFSFSVNGGAAFTVDAGQCSAAITVPVGTASVVESPSANFHIVSMTATGPLGDNRLLSGSNPITVSVAFGGVGNETLVTYTNAVNTGQFKVCKTTSEPQIIGSEVFEFDWSYTVDGTTTTGVVDLTPGECSGLSTAIPVVDSAGNPVQVSVSEVPTLLLYVSSITYAGNGSLINADTTDGTSAFDVGVGVNSITFDNEVLPI